MKSNLLANAFFTLFAAGGFLGGGFFLFLAIVTPGGYRLSSASAIQVTQVYSEATYYGIVAIALFALGILCLLAMRSSTGHIQDSLDAIEENTERTSAGITWITKTMHRQQQGQPELHR